MPFSYGAILDAFHFLLHLRCGGLDLGEIIGRVMKTGRGKKGKKTFHLVFPIRLSFSYEDSIHFLARSTRCPQADGST